MIRFTFKDNHQRNYSAREEKTQTVGGVLRASAIEQTGLGWKEGLIGRDKERSLLVKEGSVVGVIRVGLCEEERTLSWIDVSRNLVSRRVIVEVAQLVWVFKSEQGSLGFPYLFPTSGGSEERGSKEQFSGCSLQDGWSGNIWSLRGFRNLHYQLTAVEKVVAGRMGKTMAHRRDDQRQNEWDVETEWVWEWKGGMDHLGHHSDKPGHLGGCWCLQVSSRSHFL